MFNLQRWRSEYIRSLRWYAIVLFTCAASLLIVLIVPLFLFQERIWTKFRDHPVGVVFGIVGMVYAIVMCVKAAVVTLKTRREVVDRMRQADAR